MSKALLQGLQKGWVELSFDLQVPFNQVLNEVIERSWGRNWATAFSLCLVRVPATVFVRREMVVMGIRQRKFLLLGSVLKGKKQSSVQPVFNRIWSPLWPLPASFNV